MLALVRDNKKILIVVFSIFSLVIILAITYLVLTFSKIYQTENIPTTPPRQMNYTKPIFQVKSITLKDLDSDCVLEVLGNGSVTKYCGAERKLVDKKLFSTEIITKLFSSLTQTEFESFLNSYYSDSLNFQIIIETTHGTKTITINNQSSNQPSDIIQDIIDQVDDIQEEFIEPTPPPPPSLPPTPTLSPTPTSVYNPTPTPSSNPSPTPISGDPYNHEQPAFNCATITETNVTVNNTRCLPPE